MSDRELFKKVLQVLDVALSRGNSKQILPVMDAIRARLAEPDRTIHRIPPQRLKLAAHGIKAAL